MPARARVVGKDKESIGVLAQEARNHGAFVAETQFIRSKPRVQDVERVVASAGGKQ
ncbi:MAG: hypothetical protein IT331_16685 [Anaerolineae bacterium]|nr:hypothetical protein [Anaerolineae bacterium]